MKVIDPGHLYNVTNYDENNNYRQSIRFMKRIGAGYPGNESPKYGGTNCQELLRVLIDRSTYLNKQDPCVETASIIQLLRSSLLLFEMRAARRHGRVLELTDLDRMEELPTCETCGHIGCKEHGLL